MLNLEKRKVNQALLFAQCLACYFQSFYVDLGFALKPFIVVTVLTLPVVLLVNGYNRKAMLFERLFVGFAAVALIRGAVSFSSLTYIRSSVALLTVIFFYIAISQTASHLPANTVLKVLMIAGLIFFVVSMLLYVAVPHKGAIVDRGTVRLRGTTIDPNIYVAFALPLFVVALCQLAQSRILAVSTLLLGLTATFLTYSRGGLVGMGVALVLIIIKLASSSNKNLAFICLGLIALVFVLYVVQPELNSFLHLWKRPMEGNSGRVDLWTKGIELFKSRPLWGIGIDNFRTYVAWLYHGKNYLHNTYLEVLVENGLLGFTLFIGCLATIILTRSLKREAQWVKIALCGQFVLIVFLSSLTLEAIYLTAAIYKGLLYEGAISNED